MNYISLAKQAKQAKENGKTGSIWLFEIHDMPTEGEWCCGQIKTADIDKPISELAKIIEDEFNKIQSWYKNNPFWRENYLNLLNDSAIRN
jgi:hypothetical protein